jgi:hypothetical protein
MKPHDTRQAWQPAEHIIDKTRSYFRDQHASSPHRFTATARVEAYEYRIVFDQRRADVVLISMWKWLA